LPERLAWWRAFRYLEVAIAGLGLTAADTDVRLVHPLFSAQVWAEVARTAAPRGFAGRTEGMRRLFGELLPDQICARGSKARFDEAFWSSRSRAFARSWDGSGVPEEWVDASALAEHWAGEHPRAHSFTLLQAAWLASADRVEQPLHRILR
jgi:asparagine synthase (glutamine-hydrolysing)